MHRSSSPVALQFVDQGQLFPLALPVPQLSWQGSEAQSSDVTGSSGLSPCGSFLDGLEELWRDDGDLCSLLDTSACLQSASTSATSHAGNSKPENPRCAAAAGKRRGRGAKRRYCFASEAEARDARRQRNRETALLSYRKQQQRVHGLEAEAAALERQNAAMTVLLSGILSTGACPPAAASQDALEAWLATQLPGGC
ncbi:hypothetical protein ACKKBG_A29515 [Auxenochlorella protothecoides x Auxenochlorella symbiontica]